MIDFTFDDYETANILGVLVRHHPPDLRPPCGGNGMGCGDWCGTVPMQIVKRMKELGVKRLTNNFGDVFQFDKETGELIWYEITNVGFRKRGVVW